VPAAEQHDSPRGHLKDVVAPAERLLDGAPALGLVGEQRRPRLHAIEEARDRAAGLHALGAKPQRRHRAEPIEQRERARRRAVDAADRLAMAGESRRAHEQRVRAGRQHDAAVRDALVLEHQRPRAARVRAEDRVEHDVLSDVRPTGIRVARAHVCRSNVTGPSLTSSTSICAPNSPRRAPTRSQKRSYSGCACSPGAAAA
jgi:hypothetical protein